MLRHLGSYVHIDNTIMNDNELFNFLLIFYGDETVVIVVIGDIINSSRQ